MKNKSKDLFLSEREEAQLVYLTIQREEMLGELNRYFAGLKLQRPPSDTEAIMHYIESGGAQDFFNRYGHIICEMKKPL